MTRATYLRGLFAFGVLAAALVGACGDDAVDTAMVVTPAYGSGCKYEDCSGRGRCSSASGAPVCDCETGFGGSDCSVCDEGYHRDAADRCVPDRACAAEVIDPCGAYGRCDDRRGVISCVCDRGYEGPRCELCAPGHDRSSRGECVPTVVVEGWPGDGGATAPDPPGHERDAGKPRPDAGRGDDDEDGGPRSCPPGQFRHFSKRKCEPFLCPNGVPGATTETFDDLAGAPESENVCITQGGIIARGLAVFASTGGEGDAYACGPSTLYEFDSKHVFLDATETLPAQIVFDAPVSEVSFEGAAISDLVAVEVLGDDEVVGALSLLRRESSLAEYVFVPPITVLSFRNESPFKSTLALDNVTYQPACP